MQVLRKLSSKESIKRAYIVIRVKHGSEGRGVGGGGGQGLYINKIIYTFVVYENNDY